MKILMCLCLIQAYSCLGYNEYAATMDDLDHHQHGLIDRPCSLQDMKCIRQVLSSQCPPGPRRTGPPPDHEIIMIPDLINLIAIANATFLLNEAYLTGVDHFRINECYINKKTHMLVFEVEFHLIRLNAPHSEIKLYRKGMEPSELSDFIRMDFRDLSLTLTAPVGRQNKPKEHHVYAFASDAAPNYDFGPMYTQTRDPQMRRAITKIANNKGLSLQEGYVTVGPSIMAAFLQRNICGQ